ncbi:hypothetical protein [Pseudothermotoga sp.]|uniref:hypothetical protein n=1 Tax=Pseudothermotoga sp. TaxID=2033661 RepID=UPI0031F6D3EC
MYWAFVFRIMPSTISLPTVITAAVFSEDPSEKDYTFLLFEAAFSSGGTTNTSSIKTNRTAEMKQVKKKASFSFD